jgi:HK97 family phage major capsid protein
MQRSRIRELREERVRLHAEAQEILKQRNMSSEDREKFNRLMAAMDDLAVEVDRLESQAELDSIDGELRETRRPPESQISGSFESTEERRCRVAFRNYLRRGHAGLDDEDRRFLVESRDMGVGVGSGGGFLVPQGFVYEIDQALKYYGDMLNISRILETATGNPLPYPTSNDTTVMGEIVGEGAQVSTQDVLIGHIVFGAFKFSTKLVKVSLELLQDSAFDMEAFLKEQFAMRLGRVLNGKFTVGVGTTEPMGVITAATAGPTAIGSSGNTGGTETGGTSIGYIDLVELEHSVDPLYRRGAKFMMHDLTLKKVKELLDKYGHPIWVPGIAYNAPDTILGYQYSINNDMATIALNAKTVAFGPFEKYIIRRVKDLMVLRLSERFADYGQVAFIGFARYDGNLVDAGTHPIKYLVQAASLMAAEVSSPPEPPAPEPGKTAAGHKAK